MNKYLKLFIIILLCFSLTGCWSYEEINDFFIVAGVAIDKDKESNKYIVTTELINIKNNILGQSYESIKIESKGDAIFEAITTMIRVAAKRLVWSHALTLIFSEDVAKEGIVPILDWFVRDKEPRITIDVYISGAKTAKELLSNQSLSTDIRSYELDYISNVKLVKVPSLKIYEVINELYYPRNHIVLPVIRTIINNGKITNTLNGGAVFNRDKLVGYLDENDIVHYNFIRDKVQQGFIKVKEDEGSPDNSVILEVYKSKTKTKPIYTNDKISFDIHIVSDVAIVELATNTNYISKQGRDLLKVKSEEYQIEQIEATIKKVQKEFGFDIFGFSNIIRQNSPDYWKTIENDWDTIFKDLEFNINCDLNIKNSGHFTKPIEVSY